jgi:arginyl-tRNA synthetase
MLLKSKIEEVVQKALSDLSIKGALPVKIEYARDEKFGDYACTTCMDKRWRDLAASVNPAYNNPLAFAEALAGAIEKRDSKIFANVAAVKPGFINITVSTHELAAYLANALHRPAAFGKSKPRIKRNIIFEFVSANPTGPLNVVSARAAALGDSCCNLLNAAGHAVFR